MKASLPSAAVIFFTLMLGWAIGGFVAAPAKTAATPAHDHGATGAPAPGGAAAADKNTGIDTDKHADKHADMPLSSWTCSMHPQIKLPKPGICPICNMDLIPVQAGSGGAGKGVSLSKEALALARIATTEVRREAANVELRMVGKVTYDETRVARLTAWFGGRIERLFVDFTGTVVKKGDHMLALYSPELLVAQQELIQASRDRARTTGPFKASAQATYKAARDKLRLWGLQDWQIRSVVKRSRPLETVTIYAPMGGVVTHKAALEGAWVKTGTPIYTIADLSHVWVELDAYESDIAWLRYGQQVAIAVDAFPGQRFGGSIAFVNPVMDDRTRTIKVRVHIDNPDLRLKPGMFVRAVASVPVAGGGGATGGQDMAGKHVCPMHPEVIDAKPARCRVCGMKLVPAEKHWLVGPAIAAKKGQPPLVIPHTAPLITGKRVVVFVEQQGAEQPAYLVREITLGPRAGDQYVVVDGLTEGERVVSRGAFRLDSAMQIVGDPSVMSSRLTSTKESQETTATPAPVQLDEPQLVALRETAAMLIDISAGLAADDNAKAGQAATRLQQALGPVAKALPDGGGSLLKAAATVADKAAAIDARRAAYERVNAGIIPVISQHAKALGVAYDHVFCPMAADGEGAGWLQKPGDVANPYFGEKMLRCGGKKGGFAAAVVK